MKAEEIYQQETNDIKPDNQIAYNEWNERYTKWLENWVESKFETIEEIITQGGKSTPDIRNKMGSIVTYLQLLDKPEVPVCLLQRTLETAKNAINYLCDREVYKNS